MDASCQTQFARLCPCRAGLAVGILWGLGCGLVALATMFTDSYGREFVNVLGSIYPGYQVDSWIGVLLGLVWGFIDGWICGAIVAALYNCLCKCGKCCCPPKAEKAPDATDQPTAG